MMSVAPGERRLISLHINGSVRRAEVEARWLLSDVIRHSLGLTGTHVGCEQGSCGACMVLLNGEAIRSCTTLAISVDGANIVTVEGLAPGSQLSALQQAFAEHSALQCGFCTPGMLIAATTLGPAAAAMTDEDLRKQLAGQICRCTGYQPIVAAVRAGAARSAGVDA